MKKNNIILLALMGIVMSSCLTHYFAEPIPTDGQRYPSIPEPMLGVWAADDETHTIDKTTWISERIDSLGNVITKKEYELSDSLVVIKTGDFFFFNSLEQNGFWTVYLGFKKNDFFFVKGLGASDTLTFETSIGLKPDSVNNEKEFYYNTPITSGTIKKFINDGGFADTMFIFDIKQRIITDDATKINL